MIQGLLADRNISNLLIVKPAEIKVDMSYSLAAKNVYFWAFFKLFDISYISYQAAYDTFIDIRLQVEFDFCQDTEAVLLEGVLSLRRSKYHTDQTPKSD